MNDEKPLLWWNLNKSKFPTLAKLARSFLSAPASSAESERMFKVAKATQGDHRQRLLPGNLESLVFLRYNLRALGAVHDEGRRRLKSPIGNFVPPNKIAYDNVLQGSYSSDEVLPNLGSIARPSMQRTTIQLRCRRQQQVDLMSDSDNDDEESDIDSEDYAYLSSQSLSSDSNDGDQHNTDFDGFSDS